MTGISADGSRSSSSWGATIALASLVVLFCLCPVIAANDETDKGPRYCYKNGIEIGLLEASYKDNNGRWIKYDTWGWATRPKKGDDGNWHFKDHAYHDPINMTIPGEMLISFTPDKQ